ncbi:MAG: hypothetical protein P4L85_02185 [Paludisphaera borealis]|uniref:hypothetical protein n=1 Tax=Paludisphaera borealis TaxID=1387353 RepID=UPI00284167D0|nr:hypothetical protein [Paludisphaera borealis]MDR3618131.1 hypothetical protein [Paludisphaera borealis]
MKSLLVNLASLGCLGLIVAGSTVADEPSAALKAGTELLKTGDRLADEGKAGDAQIQYKTAFEKILPGLRRIPFKHEVKRDVTKRENLKAMLLKDFDEDMTPAEFEANEKALKAFGMVAPAVDLKALLVQVYSEEIAAYYDPRTKTMYMIEEPEAKKKEPPTFFDRLFGKTQGFDKDENKTVIAHEMTHALADQHFDLEGLHHDSKNNDDRSLAVSALIEGEATLAMMGVGMDDWDGTEIVKMPADGLDRGISMMTPFLPMLGGGKSLRDAPPVIVESMMFPYLRGMVFCAHLANSGGWEAIDDAYKNPPLSTEQILHPSKFRKHPDLPTEIDLGALKPGDGWKELGRNVLGELQTAILLRKQKGSAAAAGWDGDRYAVFEGPDKKLGLVWFSTWDADDEAREFAQSYVRYQTARMGKDSFQPSRIPDSLWRCVDDVCRVVERRGPDVVVIEGFPGGATAALVEAAFAAKKTEIQPSPRKIKPSDAPKTSARESTLEDASRPG